MSTIWRTTLPPGSVASVSQWTIFCKSYAQVSWVFRANPTLLAMSTIELQMEMRFIPWCTRLKYKRGRTVRKMQMAIGRSPQSLRDKIRTQGLITLRPPAWCVRWHCLLTLQGNCVNGQWILGDSGNPPLAQSQFVCAISHQEAKVLAGGVPRGTYWQLHGG